MSILDTVISMPCHTKNRGGARRAEQIKYLVYHYTANEGDRAVNNAKYYRDNAVQASAHYFVDDDAVYQSVDDLFTAWAVGGKKWTDCPRTGGGRLYGTATNTNSLSIELCGTRRDGTRRASETTLERALELGRALMEKYDIPPERVIRHFDVTGKHCPVYFMDNDAWEGFKGRLRESGAPGAWPRPASLAPSGQFTSSRPTEGQGQRPDESSGPTKKEEGMKLYHYVSDMPAWAKEACTKAIRNGYIKMDKTGAVNVWEHNLQPLVWMDRAGILDAPAREG